MALVAAWATSALVVLSSGAPWSLLPLVACGALLDRRRLVALLAVALPIQTHAGVAVSIGAPLHFHAHAHGMAPHQHKKAERHHHAAVEQAIVVDDSRDNAGDTKRSMVVDALPTCAAFGAASPSPCRPESPAVHSAAWQPRPPERPPAPSL